MAYYTINVRKVREALAPRREPYWKMIEPGRYLGVRVTDEGRYWVARARKEDAGGRAGSGAYDSKRLGGESTVLDYDAAHRAAREWWASLDAGVPAKTRVTVESACKQYVEDREREKGPKTAADARWRFTSTVYGTAFGKTELAKLRRPAIEGWRHHLKLTRAGANRMMASLRAALEFAAEHDLVSETAARAWRRVKQYPKADGRREIFLDLAQRRALLAAADPDTRDLLEAALLTGARPGELVNARRAAFDARTKTLKLTGKTGTRAVPLADAALELFERLAESKLPAALLLTLHGQAWTRIEWSRRIRAALETAVVTDDKGNVLKDDKDREVKLPVGVVLYSCRHAYISQAILDGLSALDVARLTGTSLAMIDRHYGHLVQGAVRGRLDRVQML